jgi:hypothetical protein
MAASYEVPLLGYSYGAAFSLSRRTAMQRRKYTIEANTNTLARFVSTLASFGVKVFVQKLVCNRTEEYYYVTVVGEERAHDALKLHRFTNSQSLPLD